MASVVECDGQRHRFELVIDLMDSRVEAVEARRPQDGPLLHDAPVEVRMSRPASRPSCRPRCDQY
jgi:hypothetical protein